MTYKKRKDFETGLESTDSIIRKEDGACIPFDSANIDYQAYLKWVEEGNTPDAAD